MGIWRRQIWLFSSSWLSEVSLWRTARLRGGCGFGRSWDTFWLPFVILKSCLWRRGWRCRAFLFSWSPVRVLCSYLPWRFCGIMTFLQCWLWLGCHCITSSYLSCESLPSSSEMISLLIPPENCDSWSSVWWFVTGQYVSQRKLFQSKFYGYKVNSLLCPPQQLIQTSIGVPASLFGR